MHGYLGIGNHACNMHGHVTCTLHACQTPEKRPNFLWVTGKYHACLREHTWYMHVLIYYLVSKRKFPCSMEFHTCNCLLHSGNMHVSGAPF